jgi:rhamnogalacturonan endolyase
MSGIVLRTLLLRGRRARRVIAAALIEALEDRHLLAFGLTTTSSSYTVNTGAQLVFSIARTAGSGSIGDLTSMQYNGTQLEAPFSATSRYSHYESGLSSSAVVSATVAPNNQWILITCDDLSGVGVTQYYLARKGYNNIYMAFYSPGPGSPSPGEMRFITYTNHSVLVNAPAPSNNTGNTGAIESADVFGHSDGTNSSKYYGEYPAIDTQTYGVTGGGFGVFMNIGSRETSSGGPFFKDIDYQTTSSSSTELYNYTFSGHSQTENFRPGLKGPFALEFTTGNTPAAPDYSFIDTSGVGSDITGYVGNAGRGTVSGIASGVPSTLQTTVGLSNAADQYWATPNASNGAIPSPGCSPALTLKRSTRVNWRLELRLLQSPPVRTRPATSLTRCTLPRRPTPYSPSALGTAHRSDS